MAKLQPTISKNNAAVPRPIHQPIPVSVGKSVTL
jgi:hypothetical protein